MADDDTGAAGGFPRITLPGAVGDDPPPAPDDFPALAPLSTTLAPPASLSVVQGPDISEDGGQTDFHQAGFDGDSSGSAHGVGAMSTVMMAGVAVAALRGAYHVAAYFRARQEHHRSIADRAAGRTNNGAGGIRPRMQPGAEFGRHQVRNSGGLGGTSGGRANSPRTNTPATFRAGPTPGRAPGGTGSGGRNTAPGGASGGRSGVGGTQGRTGLSEGSRTPLVATAPNGPGKGPGGRNSGVSGAFRDRAADRIRNGPAPRQTAPSRPDRSGPAGGIRSAARQRVADRITSGSWQPAGGTGSTGKSPKTPAPSKVLKGPDTLRGSLRNRVADRISTGSWEPVAAKGGTNGVSLTKTPKRPETIRGALRQRAVNYIRDWPNKPAATPDSPAAAPGPKVDLTKKPRPAAAPKVDLTKKPKKPGPAGGSGTGPAPAPPPGTSTGPGSTPGPAASAGPSSTAAGSPAGGTTGPAGPPPGPASTGAVFGPPPGWGYARPATYTVERADTGVGENARRPAATAITQGRPARPARTAATRGARPMGAPNTQYADADLTIYDVIESDEDMAEEIMQGADDARQAAEDCEVLMNRLEALHAKIQELKVPGVLEGLVLLLFEKAATVKARAEAVAETIPAASESIASAGEKAASRHKPLADAVRDAGHTAPAERDYHNE